MNERKNYEMTEADLSELLDSMRPAAMIILQCGTPPSQQERANAAWAKLGEKMNFDSSTVRPNGKGDRFFSAASLPDKPKTKPHLKMDGNQWCATHADFINLQESPAGFGNTPEEAIKELEKAAA